MLEQNTAWESAAVSDPGLLRAHNEDAMLDLPTQGIWVVSDGMGGHERGEVASALVCDTLSGMRAQSLADAVDAVDDAMQQVNARLLTMAEDIGGSGVIGCTLVALIARGDSAACVWAGDSRIYRLRGGSLQMLSEDHSLASQLAEKGQVSDDEIDHVITRAVGAGTDLFLDVDCFKLEPGDRFLLCTDGLSNELPDEALRSLLSSGAAPGIARRLVDEANLAGGSDNVTALVADYLPARA